MKKLFYLLFTLFVLSCSTPDKFTTANGETKEVTSLIGMNVFDIANEYSKVGSETLTGTNNERWIVYYKDINVTLETNKSTNIVTNASIGKKPKKDTFSN